MTVEPSRVDASAEKRFFIEMLTKDIELVPAIVDLVDNSVDGARRLHPDGTLSNQWVHVTVTPEDFLIEDNAGGIEIGVARNYAFRFGRPRDFDGVPRSVGQFGVGMKRAIFKIGDEFEVASAYRSTETDTPNGDSDFRLRVDVSEWERQPDWSFSFADHREGVTLAPDVQPGTRIRVTRLHPSVSEDFADQSVVDGLRRELRLRHQEPLGRGLELVVNGERLLPLHPSLQSSPVLRPIRRDFAVPVGNASVRVELFAGTVQGETNRDNGADLGDAEQFQDPSEAGWYIFCNDRLLIAADTTYVTGWGNPAAAFHPQYRLFRGYVYLSAEDAGLLPWNTTKTAVDRDSPVFRVVASEMKKTLVEVQSQINKQEKVRRAHRAAVRDAEVRGEATPETPAILRAFDDTADVPVRELALSDKMASPPEPPPVRRRRAGPPADIKRIQYEVDIRDFERVSDVLGTSSGSDVGRQTFAYFLESEVH